MAMLLGLFAACTPTEQTPSPSAAPTTSAPAAGTTAPDATAAPIVDSGVSVDPGEYAPPEKPHNTDDLAVNPDGTLRYEIDEIGLPFEWYEYSLPLTTSTETLRYWVPTFVPTLIDADGAASMPYQTLLRETTGVILSYEQFGYMDAQTSYTTMIASDDLADIVAWGVTYWIPTGIESNMIDEGFFANINDYRAYAPDFFYQINRFDRDPELINAIWINDDMITNMGPYREASTATDAQMTIRGDWVDTLDQKGLLPAGVHKSEDIHTYEQYEAVMALFQTETIQDEQGFPLLFMSSGEPWPTAIFGGMNTAMYLSAPIIKVVDGRVTFTMMEDVDFNAATTMIDWLDKGYIGSQWASYNVSTDVYPILFNEGVGIYYSDASGISTIEENCQIVNPNARWEAVHTPALTENFDFKFDRSAKAYDYNMMGSGWSFSAKGKNVPLAISYGDWFYSEDGSFIGSWGVEGLTYEFDENGKPQRTEFVMTQQSGFSLGMFLWAYQQFSFMEPVRFNIAGLYAYPGGDRYFHSMEVWNEEFHMYRFGVDYDWPSSTAKPSQSQQDEVDTYLLDANTWFAENVMLFFDGSKPLTKENWDAYVSGLKEIGYERYAFVMQNVYDAYVAKRGV
jgi:putative aldouronate transport system substrate-binding protein